MNLRIVIQPLVKQKRNTAGQDCRNHECHY
jgi:hypothetical protein